jgi:cell division protein FtsI/penicillin-binding protein 2
VLALAAALAFVAGYLVHGPLLSVVRSDSPSPSVAGSDLAAAPELPSVSSGTASEQAQPAPAELFARLPVARADYDSNLRVEAAIDPAASARWVETVELVDRKSQLSGPMRIEYTFDAELTRRVMKVLDRGRVQRGHVIVLDPRTGRVLAYVSTDAENFPPDRAYPAASLVKVVTAAAALQTAPEQARRPCIYRGNQYRLTRSRVRRPKYGNQASLERALATSNNQCFAQLAVETVGSRALLDTIESFGWLEEPAPGHSPGSVDAGDDDYDLGRLGCGLSGCRITPLHAAQLAASLAHGELVAPWWIDRVLDADGRELALPARTTGRRVMSQRLAEELRAMLVRTTTRGTARSAFRGRRGRPKLGEIKVAGKTGNITGTDPYGRYEWFIGVAPADDPSIAVAVVQVQSNLWWAKSSQIAADVLVETFCEKGRCKSDHARRFTGELGTAVSPIMLSEVAGH